MGVGLKETESSTRLPYLDYARVFAAYFVILGHLVSTNDTTIRPYIYAFHMPFFFLVSGMLHKNRGCIAWKKYFKTLIVPFFFFNLLLFFLWPLCWKIGVWKGSQSLAFDPNINIFNVYFNYLLISVKRILIGKGGPDGPTWFLLALFWCKLSIDILNCKRLVPHAGIFLFLGVIGIAFYPKTYLQIGNALMVIPFFYCGFRYKRLIQKWCENGSLFLGICLLLIVIPLTLVNGKVSVFMISYGHCLFPLNVLIFYVNAFLSSLGLLRICMIFQQNKYITISAKALISILCIHAIFIYSSRTHCNSDSLLFCIVCSFIIITACVLCHLFIERHMPIIIGK